MDGGFNSVAHDLIDISAPAQEQSAFDLADDPYNVEEEKKDDANSIQ